MTMLLCGTARLQDIISLKSKLSFELLNLRRKLTDLQTYAASIGDGIVSADDLMNSPASMFQKMSIFMAYSNKMSMDGANQNMALLSQTPGGIAQMQNETLQQQYNQMVFNNLYKQQSEKFAQYETSRLNVEEKKMDQEISEKETQLQLLESEQKTTKEAVTQAAKDSAPNYV